ncbi:MAG: T9SS type A sorting domain-containing protein [Sporocytophaga sp.]|uniref:DUF7619 domain-containing protein n=1 Tax=Sporocytophaga sp. TaxID=2231183 RepID=UPI001B0D9A85|nr:T9SS type A sorting domain-containing protein [Sporocytophaga sp.]MBO9702358.1 T9SS type A sorting domain-containing protein [Sporocytophaga sp.]
MRKIFFFLISLIPLLTNAQMNTWERFHGAEIKHPFKDFILPDPDVDSLGNKWILNNQKKSLWKIHGTDTTKFENFPDANFTLGVFPNGTVALFGYSGSAEKGYTNYMGYCDGTTLKFYSESVMRDVLTSASNFTGVFQTDNYIWIRKTDRLIRFDKVNSFKEYTMAEHLTTGSMGQVIQGRDYLIIFMDRVPYIYRDAEDVWKKLLPDDPISAGYILTTSNAVYMIGTQKSYRFMLNSGTLETSDFGPTPDLGTLSSIDEFNRDFFAYSYTRGLVVTYKGQVSIYKFTDYVDGDALDYYNEYDYWSKTLENGISMLTVSGGDGNRMEELHFSFQNGVVKFEGKTGVHNSFMYKELNGDKFYYYTTYVKAGESYMTIVKNELDTTKVRMPEEFNGSVVLADSSYLYVGGEYPYIWRMNRNQYFMKGILFYDTNRNGIKDAEEVGINKYAMEIKPAGIKVFADQNGYFSFAAEPGQQYILEIPADSIFDYVSKEFPYTLSGSEVNMIGFTIRDFKPEVRTNFYLPWPRCNTTASATLRIENPGILDIEKVRLTLIGDPLVKITSMDAVEKTTDTLVFEVNDLGSFNSKTLLYDITFPNGNSVGKPLVFKLISDFYSSGLLVHSDMDSLNTTVKCSTDPNDKAVTPIGLGDNHLTLFNTPLDYLIRFENTGNDTAYVVAIHDTLDVNLDASTLEVKGSSHDVITEVNKDGKVIFHFENIMLPDSTTNKEKAQGFVRFTIKPKKNIAEMTVIRNKAGIIFDKNDPVITNEVFNTFVSHYPVVASVEGPKENNKLIYPNPASTQINIKGVEGTYTEIYDFTGKQVYQTNETIINTSDWLSGLYVFRIFDLNGKALGVEKVLVVK